MLGDWLVLFGGLGLLLHGLSYCSEGLQRSAGQRMKALIRRMTLSPVRAAVVGGTLAALLQSSTSVTVMLVSLANAGLVTLAQAVGVILGADVGTTLAVQLLAFDTGPWSLALVATGYLLSTVAKRKWQQYLGQAMIGLGLVFFGLRLIGSTVAVLRGYPTAGRVLATVAGNPWLSFAAATLFTALVHSSAAALGVAVSLASHGLLTLPQAIPIILGANVGTAVTAVLHAAGTSTEPRRVALAHIFIKLTGVVFLWPLAGPFTRLVASVAAPVPRQIANAHTAFNALIVLVGLPLAAPLAALVQRLVPANPAHRDPGCPQYLDRRALEAPAVALEQAAQEVARLGELVEQMFACVPDVLVAQNQGPFQTVADLERCVDRLSGEINTYLADIGARNLGEDLARNEVSLLHVVLELEHAADAIFKISLLARKRFDQALTFSGEGLADMLVLHRRVQVLLRQVLVSLTAGEPAPGPGEAVEIQAMERQLRETHLARLRAGLEVSRATSAIHLDILAGLQRVAEHAASISEESAGQGNKPWQVAPGHERIITNG
ncbi:MAG: Na/Pi cotransporter family protein [Chitinophagales bacterium]